MIQVGIKTRVYTKPKAFLRLSPYLLLVEPKQQPDCSVDCTGCQHRILDRKHLIEDIPAMRPNPFRVTKSDYAVDNLIDAFKNVFYSLLGFRLLLTSGY